MRRFLPTFFIIILVLALYPFFTRDGTEAPKLTGLPWQIEILPDGHTKVFGIIPGVSTLNDAATALGDDFQLAIVENKSDVSLEMYFSHYRAGLMTAKLVLVAATDATVLEHWQQRAAKVDYMKSGRAVKYMLADEDRYMAMQSVVRALTFIPAVNLDADILHKRFGEPAQLIEQAPGLSHYLYPEKGLAIALSAEAKEVLQYVAPADFSRLQAPLLHNLTTD